MKHEDFVSYEQAKALKESGFDWGTRAVYRFGYDGSNETGFVYGIGFMVMDYNNSDYGYSAPTLAQAQKWLREVKGILVYTSPSVRKDEPITWMIGVINLLDKVGKKLDWFIGAIRYDAYEQALSAGIGKAIELLKEEGK